MTWTNSLKKDIEFFTYLKQLPTKGKIAWEYNPLRNYRLDKTMWEYRSGLYSEEQLKELFGYDFRNDELWYLNTTISSPLEEQPTKRLKGELCDFITDLLAFSLEHPVNIIPLYSYDGSVNLILNDGLNEPRLINTRFSTTGMNTYEVINRKGDGDTNIYDQGDLFDIDTSLYKKVNNIPKLEFKGITLGGNLKCGNYHFYFKYTDQDNNETDFVAESGLVSVFVGGPGPFSSHTGTENENSAKQVSFLLSNIDTAYEYVNVYYSRSYASYDEAALISYKKIDKKFLVNTKQECLINITGFDEEFEVTSADINVQYNIVDSAKAHATAKGMLFLGNVHKLTIPYEELSDLSLRFLPYLKDELYELQMNETYSIRSKSKGYYDPKVIYSSVGYWEKDLYRLGIVYILSNNELTSVFNIRGGIDIKPYNKENPQYSEFNFTLNKLLDGEKVIIQSNEATHYIIPPESGEGTPGTCQFENSKGVISLAPDSDTNTVHSIDIRVELLTIDELKKLGIKGFFFVRQKRMPLTLCQAITIATDVCSHTPTLPTCGELIERATSSSEDTYMEYNLNPALVNYVSEGFMTRYRYKVSRKKNSVWKTVGIIAGITALVALGVVGTIFTAGAAGAAAGATIAAILGEGWTAITASSVVTYTLVAGASIVGAAAIYGVESSIYSATHWSSNRDEQIFNGRETKLADGVVQVEKDDSRLLGGTFANRLIVKALKDNLVNAALCPEYDVNSPYYNQLFTGIDFIVKETKSQAAITDNGNDVGIPYFKNNERHFYIPEYVDSNDYLLSQQVKIQGVPDGRKLVMCETSKFRSRAGWPEEAWRYESVGHDYSNDWTKINEEDDKSADDKNEDGKALEVYATWNQVNSDIIRGDYGPYLGLVGYTGMPCKTLNIMIPGYLETNMDDYIQIRMNDSSSYFAITDRIDIQNLKEFDINHTNFVNTESTSLYSFPAYRGDCYICQFTHRLNRNFQDPNSPLNDIIVDAKSWKDNYNPNETEKYSSINLGDVNAVQLGMWVTFRVRSQYNLNIRTLDESMVDECAAMGHPKGFYPYFGMSTEGTYKCSDSLIYNKGFAKSVSERYNFELLDVPAIKNWYGTRIMYSEKQITDAYRNSYRVFKGTTYKDYTRQYGEITKLINIQDNLLVIFEHGIALATVNEKMIAALATSGYAYVTTNNVLPEDLTIISESFGTLWPDSVIQTPQRGDVASIIFGVDTVAKKIWMYKSGQFKIISDFTVQKFLNDNLTLGERELTPVLGIRNVKTFYNAFKLDVMFTFYDNLDSHTEKVWNLCYNIIMDKFVTFYSWVPSFMENIDNIPFSFDRNISKWIAKLGISHSKNSFAKGITLNSNIYNLTSNDIGKLELSNVVLPTVNSGVKYTYEFKLERDIYGNYKYFQIERREDSNGEYYMLCLKDYSDDLGIINDGNGNLIWVDTDENNEVNPNGSEYLKSNNIEAKDAIYASLYTELYNRNKYKRAYADYTSSIFDTIDLSTIQGIAQYFKDVKDFPIYKNKLGKRITIDNPINKDKIVLLLNITCKITAHIPSTDTIPSLQEYLKGNEGQSYIDNGITYNKVDVGEYKSTIAVTSKWNTQFLTSDFWKHGQSGFIDICDDIYPAYWYGQQHPFEFECIVVKDPSLHKIFRNLEIIANKAEPESFHYEIVGECYDFAKDKPNMYFRQEARKALFQYNGCDITYNKNFSKIEPKLLARSAELISQYYERLDSINEIYDYYCSKNEVNKDYRNLSGAEITYYPYRQEFRIWQHTPAVNLDNLDLDNASNIIRANCQYLEDRWKVTINPILITYKNEYKPNIPGPLCVPDNSTWFNAYDSATKLPPITIKNTNLPRAIKEAGFINFPTSGDNALVELYDLGTDENPIIPVDTTNWLNSLQINNYGEASNRKEIDLKDKFLKVRIRYSGKDLAVIDFLNTIYEVSYA